MKNIFIATDFSEASVNAGFYAVELARHLKARVFLFHAYEVPIPIPESYFFVTPGQAGEEAMKRLTKEAETINRYGIVDIQLCASEGPAARSILSEATRADADLIVCGMKGNGKAFRKIFGSTATELVRKSAIPLMIIPANMQFRLPNNVAFASDLTTMPTVQHIQLLKEMGELFGSKLSVVSVVDDEKDTHLHFREDYIDFIQQLKVMRPTFECLQGPDISTSLENYIKRNYINMIAMIPHAHSFLEKIFIGSITRKMAFLTHVPLLLLPGKTTRNKTAGKALTGASL